MTDVRPVWLTRKQREMDSSTLADLIDELWDAAPADPVEAAREAGREAANAERIPDAVLRALGAPDDEASEAPPERRDSNMVVAKIGAVSASRDMTGKGVSIEPDPPMKP